MVTCSDTRIFLSVTTSCEIRRLVSSSPPAPPNRRHWISPPVIPSVATSCEIRRLVSSSPPAPPNRRHWISPPPSPQLRLLARYADLYLRLRRRLRIDVTGYLRRHPLSCDFLRDTPTCNLSSSPPAPPNRRHWISPPPSPQLRLLARYADSYLSVRRRLRIDDRANGGAGGANAPPHMFVVPLLQKNTLYL